MGDNTVLLGLS